MRVLVVGDRIIDQYRWCRATRLCPEAPAPVLHIESESTVAGGAANVEANLVSLIGRQNVVAEYGSISHKERTFADRTLVCRVDRDKHSVCNSKLYADCILSLASRADVIVVGDYGKDAITLEIAHLLLDIEKNQGKRLFVDAKHNVDWYQGCFAVFPNENEHNHLSPKNYQHIIRKLGPKGCSVDGMLVPTTEQQVYDVTGAGDVFLAAFVAHYGATWHGTDVGGRSELGNLCDCAKFANKAAGISVRHLGTYVIKPEEVYKPSAEEVNNAKAD
jgi:bifunctional ADP-heptose synthase (sugar kinase/adenylyltransferase)